MGMYSQLPMDDKSLECLMAAQIYSGYLASPPSTFKMSLRDCALEAAVLRRHCMIEENSTPPHLVLRPLNDNKDE